MLSINFDFLMSLSPLLLRLCMFFVRIYSVSFSIVLSFSVFRPFCILQTVIMYWHVRRWHGQTYCARQSFYAVRPNGVPCTGRQATPLIYSVARAREKTNVNIKTGKACKLKWYTDGYRLIINDINDILALPSTIKTKKKALIKC